MTTHPPRWVIRKSGFPFTAFGQHLGTCLAETKSAAERMGRSVFGCSVICERDRDPFDDDPFPYKNPLPDQAKELELASRQMRLMTPIEVQMARAVGCCKYPPGQKGTIRRLHAEALKPRGEISDELAKKLRGYVLQLRSQMPAELLESIGDLEQAGAA